MTFCIIGSPHAFARNSHEVGVQFAIAVFVVEDTDCIGAFFDVWKVADGVSAGDRGLGVSYRFISVFWEAVSRRVEVAHNLAPVVAQAADFHMDQIRWGRLRLGWQERQRVRVERLASNGVQGAADDWRDGCGSQRKEQKLCNGHKLPMSRPVKSFRSVSGGMERISLL